MGPDTIIDWKGIFAFLKDCLLTFLRATIGKMIVAVVIAILGAILLGIVTAFGG